MCLLIPLHIAVVFLAFSSATPYTQHMQLIIHVRVDILVNIGSCSVTYIVLCCGLRTYVGTAKPHRVLTCHVTYVMQPTTCHVTYVCWNCKAPLRAYNMSWTLQHLI